MDQGSARRSCHLGIGEEGSPLHPLRGRKHFQGGGGRMAIGRCCNIDGAIDGTWRAGVETGEDGGNRKGEISPIGDEHKDREKEKNGYIYILQCILFLVVYSANSH